MKKSNNETPDLLGPWKFPRGSLESRAAARAMIEHREHTGIRLTIVLAGHPRGDCLGRWCRGTCGLLTGRFAVVKDGVVEVIDGHT